MKKTFLFSLAVLCFMPYVLFAQDYEDDLYYVPSKSKKVQIQVITSSASDSEASEEIALSAPESTIVSSEEMDVDAYNRRYSSSAPAEAGYTEYEEEYEDNSDAELYVVEDDDYTYTTRIIRFRNPSLIIHLDSPYYWSYSLGWDPYWDSYYYPYWGYASWYGPSWGFHYGWGYHWGPHYWDPWYWHGPYWHGGYWDHWGSVYRPRNVTNRMGAGNHYYGGRTFGRGGNSGFSGNRGFGNTRGFAGGVKRSGTNGTSVQGASGRTTRSFGGSRSTNSRVNGTGNTNRPNVSNPSNGNRSRSFGTSRQNTTRETQTAQPRREVSTPSTSGRSSYNSGGSTRSFGNGGATRSGGSRSGGGFSGGTRSGGRR